MLCGRKDIVFRIIERERVGREAGLERQEGKREGRGEKDIQRRGAIY